MKRKTGRINPTLPVAVLLVGGMGTRLRGVVADRQKAVAEVAGRPFVMRLLDQLIAAGVRRVVLATGYQAQGVRQILGDQYGPLSLRYSVETEPLGTGGAVAQAADLAMGEPLLVLNGDSYCDCDLASLWRTHEKQGAFATLQLAIVPDTSRFGRVEIDRAGRIICFAEKDGRAIAGLVNAGIYCLSPAAVADIRRHGMVSLERECFARWVGRGLATHGPATRFIDIGTPESYAAAAAFFAA